MLLRGVEEIRTKFAKGTQGRQVSRDSGGFAVWINAMSVTQSNRRERRHNRKTRRLSVSQI